MKNEAALQTLINQIQTAGGEQFTYNEKAMLDEYRKKSANQSGLAIKILSVAGGFLAIVVFLGFLFVAGIYDSTMGLLVFGIIFIGASVILNKIYDKLITDTLSITAFVLGFILLGLALSKLEVNDNLILIVFIIIAIVSLLIMQSYMLSFIGVLVVNGSLLALIFSNEAYNLIHLHIVCMAVLTTFCFLKEAKMITSSKKLASLYDPVRIGLVFSLLISLLFVGKSGLTLLSANYLWLSSIITIGLILYLIQSVLRVLQIHQLKDKILIYIASVLLLVPTVFAPAVAGAILLILLSFLVNYKTGFVISMVAFIYFISQYYYDLNLTLLVKSGILFSLGILFLLFYVFTHKKLGTDEKV
ncbi:MAG: DUF4401 domain-containing protein [Verrucomicrobia bacterium]|nr:DUF4401 domain-containing protein [Cytophagales bacterium]